ncbi:MAG: hypothetical protein ACI4JW_04725 [Oscillospiraceae bacterium]
MNIDLNELLRIFLFIAVPMILVQLLYRFVDRKGSITRFFTKRFTFLKTHKTAVQIVSAVIFIAVFGAVCSVFEIHVNLYYSVCGAYIGFLNGMAITIMNDE